MINSLKLLSRTWIILSLFVVLSCCGNNQIKTETNPLSFLTVAHVGNQYLIENSFGQVISLNGVNLAGTEDQSYDLETGTRPNYPINPKAYQGVCPVNDGESKDPPVCEVSGGLPINQQSYSYLSQNDFAQIRHDGFNVVRLAINWSEIEPSPGYYSYRFLNRVKQIVNWATEARVYVILDFHQDGYSRFLSYVSKKPTSQSCVESNGQDGAPLWAVITDNQPNCEILGQSMLDPAMSAAWMNFWMNTKPNVAQGEAPGNGLQDHYIGAIAFLAKAFKDNPTVAGYEIINEPFPGIISTVAVANPYVFTLKALYPFYARVIEAITGVRDNKPTCPKANPSGKVVDYSGDNYLNSEGRLVQPSQVDPCSYPNLGVNTRQLIFFEPEVLRDQLDFSFQDPTLGGLKPFSSYKNLVFAPHIYTNVFTLNTLFSDQHYPGPIKNADQLIKADQSLVKTLPSEIYPPNYFFADATALFEANELHSALVITEYGSSNSATDTILAGIRQAQLYYGFSAIFWVFKENCQSRQDCASWGLYDAPAEISKSHYLQNGPLRINRIQIVDPPRFITTIGSASRTIDLNPYWGLFLKGGNLFGKKAALLLPFWMKSYIVKFWGSCYQKQTLTQSYGELVQLGFSSNKACFSYIGPNMKRFSELKNALGQLQPIGLTMISDVKAMTLVKGYTQVLKESTNPTLRLKGQILSAVIAELTNG